MQFISTHTVVLDQEAYLLTGFRAGEEWAMKQVFDRFFRPLSYFAHNLIGNREEASDIAIHLLQKCWEKRTEIDSISAIGAYLFTGVRNRCIDYARQQKVRAGYREELLLTQPGQPVSDPEVTDAFLFKMVAEAIEALPGNGPAILKMSLLEGMDIAEIAAKLSITPNHARVQKSRALAALRPALLQKGLDTGVYLLLFKFF